MYSSRTCEGISLDARRRANGRRCADVRLVVVVHHGRLPRLVGVIHRRAWVKEEYRRRVSPVADAVVDSVVEGSQPASSRSSRLEKHTNVPSATESRRSSVPLGMSTVAHQPTPAMGEGRNSVGKSVRMERRSFRGPAPRSRQIPGEETKLQCYFTKDVKTWGPQSRFEPDSQSSDKRERTIDTHNPPLRVRGHPASSSCASCTHRLAL